MKLRALLTTMTVLLAATSAWAQLPGSQVPGYEPLVPVSSFARPASWFDASRLHLTTEVSVGSSMSGAMDGLQVTRLSYQFGAPLSMRVSVGNAFGAAAARGGNAMFLEGLDVSYQPFRNFLIQVHYQDVRSPLQYRSGYDPYYSRR